mgnify:CR=1 FL=1
MAAAASLACWLFFFFTFLVTVLCFLDDALVVPARTAVACIGRAGARGLVWWPKWGVAGGSGDVRGSGVAVDGHMGRAGREGPGVA